MLAEINAGRFQGIKAIGAASAIKERTRVTKLALTVAACVERDFFPGSYYGQQPIIRDLIQFASWKLRAGPQTQPPPQAPRALPAPAAASQTWGQPQPAQPQAAQMQLAVLSAPAQQAVATGAPVECMRDPFAELRPWQDGNGYWPWCGACEAWSDSAHIKSRRHTNKLRAYGYQEGADGRWTGGSYMGGQQQQPHVLGASPQTTWQQDWQHTQQLALPAPQHVTPPPATAQQPVSAWAPEAAAQATQAPSQPMAAPRLPRPKPTPTGPAPPMPTMEQILDWNGKYRNNFEWHTVRGYPLDGDQVDNNIIDA